MREFADKAIALFVSDIHLSDRPPLFRATEPDWFMVMAGYMDQLKTVHEYTEKLNKREVPIFCAGDIFHKWNPSPRLINWAIENVPKMYSIPGQHDLPLHRYSQIEDSAYWTLVKADILTDMKAGVTYGFPGGLHVTSFPWGTPLKECTRPEGINVALVHAYCWRAGHGYHGAEDTQTAKVHAHHLTGFDVAVFGDNHKGFDCIVRNKKKNTTLTVVNCGGFMIRNRDELDRKPRITSLHADGSVHSWWLDISLDEYLDVQDQATKATALTQDFVDLIMEPLNDLGFDFSEALSNLLRSGLPSKVRQVLTEVYEEIHK